MKPPHAKTHSQFTPSPSIAKSQVGQKEKPFVSGPWSVVKQILFFHLSFAFGSSLICGSG
jgi:hypothetical protein